MKIKLFTVLLALVAFLSACGSSPPEGVVYDKEHTAAWTQFSPICTKGGCVMVPFHHNEKWEIRLCPRRPTTDDQCGWRTVTEDEYDALEVGDYYEAVAK